MEINNYCRVCTSNNPEMLSIFEDYKFSVCNLQIFEVITKCASIQIEKLDGFSERICKRCTEHLRQAFSFKQLCEDSDYKFRHNLIDALKIDAYCNEAVKIQCGKANENEINNIFIEVKAEIESEFYEEDAQYGISHEEDIKKSSDFTILQNLDAILQDGKPNKKSSELNINLEQTKLNYTEVNNRTHDVRIEIKSEFYAEETNIQYDALESEGTSRNSSELQNDCKHCGQRFIDKTTLNNHIEDEHATELIKHKEPFGCETCGKTFRDKGTLNIHYKIHPEKTPFKCKTCGMGFMRQLNLNRHNKLHSGEKQHKCETCGKSFAEKHKLIFHRRTHTGEKPFKCETCDKRFTLKEQLNIHKSVHTGEKHYKCAACGKCFSGPSSLSKHRKKHTGERPHKCEMCDKCFPIKAELTIHKRSHTGEKPYKCEICDKCFVSKSNLNVHMRIHLGQKPFKCEVCNRGFTQRAQMVQHTKIHTVEN